MFRHTDLDLLEPLPERAMLSLIGSLPTPFDTSGLASFVQNAGAASGNAQQTAPITQGLASAPTVPTL